MPARAIPPRGWKYQQGETTITGYGYEDLIDKIVKFRTANSIPLGSPTQDYESYVRDRWPSFTGFKRLGTQEEQDVREVKELVEKSSRTALEEITLSTKLAAYSKSTGRWTATVSEAKAEARYKNCIACPSRRDLNSLTNCAPCISDLTRQATLIVEGKKMFNAGFCASLLHDNRLAVWLPKEGLERSLGRVQDAPEGCWLRNL